MKQSPEIFLGLGESGREAEFKSIYYRAFCSVVTRCFGWGLPTTTMVPFADFINHHNVDSSYELVSSDFNPRDPNSGLPEAYYTNSK